jgi:chorismate dehydratase
MVHGPQQGLFNLEFRTPAGCADDLSRGAADIGIVPSFELTRQRLEILRGAGIACRGSVRSILLISKKPADAIETLAADSSSRTSVELARVVLERRYGCRPKIARHAPEVDAMLETADAALVIGDPALRIDPASRTEHVYDLGLEWWELTGLPMVFAVWAGRAEVATEDVREALAGSCRWGREHIEEIVAAESGARGFAPDLVREYLTRHIVHELGPEEYAGMEQFLEWSVKEGRTENVT